MMRKIAAVVLLFALAACSGGGDEPKAEQTTAAFEAPAGVTVSPAGTEKKIGESMAFAYPDVDDEAGTVLAVGVPRLDKALRRDLSLFRIPDGMRPYYLRVAIGNRGPAPAAFPDGLPLWLHVAGDVLVPPTATPGGFRKCPAPRVAKPLAAGATVKGCLLYFVPIGTAVESVDFQPGDVTTAVRWRP